ncbi:recombinase family protein [Peptoniphilus rhinitidis]
MRKIFNWYLGGRNVISIVKELEKKMISLQKTTVKQLLRGRRY